MRNILLVFFIAVFFIFSPLSVDAHGKRIEDFSGRPPIHVHQKRTFLTVPGGLTPSQVKKAYNLPATGGSNTIAIIDAYDYTTAENDLNVFDTQFGLPTCTTANGCFEKHKMASFLGSNSGWALEEALDIQWAHAIAPNAKILLVEAKSNRGSNLLAAVNYAKNRSDVVAISMSWGGLEFTTEAQYDSNFISPSGATFFAASGDSGSGVEWPAVSPNVVGVGGTTLSLNPDATVANESAWNGSGGGISAFEQEPSYQTSLVPSIANGKRAVPDVSFVADPATGVSIYDSTSFNGQRGWFTVGGTSVGTPQWAAIRSLGSAFTPAKLYSDAVSSYATFYRDIITGTNGSCGTVCTAQVGYDFITGLGSPIISSF